MRQSSCGVPRMQQGAGWHSGCADCGHREMAAGASHQEVDRGGKRGHQASIVRKESRLHRAPARCFQALYSTALVASRACGQAVALPVLAGRLGSRVAFLVQDFERGELEAQSAPDRLPQQSTRGLQRIRLKCCWLRLQVLRGLRGLGPCQAKPKKVRAPSLLAPSKDAAPRCDEFYQCLCRCRPG